MNGQGQTPLLSCRSVSKYFGAMAAVKDLSFDISPGEVLGIACRAERTVTFAAAKHGLLTPAARDYVGEVEVAGLGIPEH